MLYLFIALILVSAYLIYHNKYSYIRFFCLFLIFGSFGGLGDVLVLNIAPQIKNSSAHDIALITGNILFTLSFLFTTYFFLIFGIDYSQFFKFKDRKTRNIIFLLLTLFPLSTLSTISIYPKFEVSFIYISLWGVPYNLFTNFCVFYAYIKENPIYRRNKTQKLLTFIVLCPPTLFVLASNYILPIFGLRYVYIYNTPIIIVFTLFFFVASFKYGVFGFKFYLGKQALDLNNTFQALSSGTSLINHIIKNEAVKISICSEDLKKYIGSSKEAAEDISIINSSADHMLNMMMRIQEKTQEIVIYEQTVNLNNIIENAINISKPLLESKSISIKKCYLVDIMIRIDKVHIQDVLCNIIKNAIEAIKDNGEIKINLAKTKYETFLSIQDNGIGISKENMEHVFEPFFSTKNRHHNYGLGLTYCFNVMQKHNGTIEILSEENKGTQVILKFPLKRVNNPSEDL